MNTSEPPDSGWLMNTGKVAGFVYGIGISIGILLLITTITIASYYCTRNRLSASPMTTSRNRRRRQTEASVEEPFDRFDLTVGQMSSSGLNEDTIKSLPKLPYEEARESYTGKREGSIRTTTLSCSICLADYKSKDMIRVLPDCHHLFHDKCVDPWLLLNPTCPICRSSPSPSPVAGVFPRGLN
ncbi:PREDICTED: putative RING-H2 finger protein ATL71 [Tarenaya hassleriana]|uniref:putative RING-H2 finger protein ATL71 n=1 Tax=Tarenaya hassleriana TaxID=28532 RepID=UPI00053C13FE|nr:PREDICTED: putative RING-H2 finger protein ATL71 [Tarenaya hassleriana]